MGEDRDLAPAAGDTTVPGIVDAFQQLIDSDIEGLLDMPDKPQKITAGDRLARAFGEVVEFRRAHGRPPSSTTREIAERKLGARLDGILSNDEKIQALQHFDEFGLLEVPEAPGSIDDLLDADPLNLLGDETGVLDMSGLPTRKKPAPADDVAQRRKASGFEEFEPLFKQKHVELAGGSMRLVPFPGVESIVEGRFFVLNGVMLFIAEVGETRHKVVGGKPEKKQRLRVIFENGTESSMYRQSLSIRLHEQNGFAVGRSEISASEIGDADVESGFIYVLRSRSNDPQIVGIADLHKIGFSRGPVTTRIKNAAKSPTYLMAPVEVVATYRVYNVRASALENLLHRVFAEARLDLTQIDRKGRDYDPSEWFVVPHSVIDQAITLIMSGDIVHYHYDTATQRIVPNA
jgi:hypothetical protein